MTQRLLTLTETGRRLGVSRWTVRAWINNNYLPAACLKQMGPRTRVVESALNAWLVSTRNGREVTLVVGDGERVPRRGRAA